MEENKESLLSLIYYENDIIKSYDCFSLDDDLIELRLCHDYNIIGSISLNSAQVKSLITLLNDDTDKEEEMIEINDILFKKSFISNLEQFIDE